MVEGRIEGGLKRQSRPPVACTMCPHQSVVMHVAVVMSLPWPHCGADDYGVYVRSHGVLYVGWHEEKAPNRIGFRSLLVEFGSDGDFQCTRDNGNPGVLIVGVVLPVSGGNGKCVSEGLAGGILVAFQNRPLGSVGIGVLPNDVASIPRFHCCRLPHAQCSS